MPDISGLKEILHDTQGAALTALENPFSVGKKKEILEPEPMLDVKKIEGFNPLNFKVSLIMIGNGKKIAIINGKILKEGGLINGFKVNKIEDKKVLLFSKNVSYWIKINDNNQE